ncbi:MAG: hypothetical protein M3203_02890, partial [Actinomycetota bacterium]|nr:hypothetical protein [Actinomycetota bacterium]
MRRLLATLAITLITTPVPATAAAAGALTAVPSTNFHTRLRAVEPRVPGLELKVIELGNRLELTNRTGTEVVVLGYEDEPYLRVGSDGVFTNRLSPATYLSADRRATRTVPEEASPDAPPEWVRVAGGPVARWYDHRVHWMGVENPPAVRAAPDERHVVFPNWTVPLLHGDVRVEARGDLVWVPGPGLWPWLLVAVAPVGAATLLLGAAVFYRYDGWRGRPLAVAVILLLGVAVALVLGTVHRTAILVAGGGAVAISG